MYMHTHAVGLNLIMMDVHKLRHALLSHVIIVTLVIAHVLASPWLHQLFM